MEELLKNLSTVGWWLSVVVVGIALNLVSSYLYKGLDSWLSGLSFWWRSRSEKRAKLFEEEVSILVERPDLEPHYFQVETRTHLQGIQFSIFAISFMVLSLWVLYVPSLRWAAAILWLAAGLMMVMYSRAVVQVAKISEVVAKARRRRNRSSNTPN